MKYCVFCVQTEHWMKELLKKTLQVFESGDNAEIFNQLKDLKQKLEQVSGIQADGENERMNIATDTGMALGTTWAAACLDDLKRTSVFTRGLIQSIKDKLESGVRPVQVLYAGTGPYATLILPALAHFSPEEVQCTLLEINPISFDLMQHVISECGFEEHVQAFVNGDACSYTPDVPADILLTETMQSALAEELQVPITLNLLPQMKPDATLIPEKIIVFAGLRNMSRYMENPEATEHHCRQISPLFEISKEAIPTYNGEPLSEILHARTVNITPDTSGQFDQLVLLTDIRVYGDERILTNQSGLTVPLLLHEFRDDRPVKIHFAYRIASGIGFDYTFDQDCE